MGIGPTTDIRLKNEAESSRQKRVGLKFKQLKQKTEDNSESDHDQMVHNMNVEVLRGSTLNNTLTPE